MSTSSRIAINTTIQYIKIIINVLIGLWSVRIILSALGAEDYGIYDVVGGVIGLLGFIQASLSQTSIRFLSLSIGSNNTEESRNTFNNCFWLHAVVAMCLCLILLVVGRFLLDSFLTIPSSRVYAASVVYYCMIVTLFIQIISTPFQALLISHERFVYVALVSIMDAALKLIIAFVILHFNGDKLVLYGVLMMMITLLNTIIYISLCSAKYRTSLYISKFSAKGIKSVYTFAGWTLLDVLGTVMTRQGYAVMLNKFFGPIVNAAFALARQLEGLIYTISASVIDTMKPQIMISYGVGDEKRMLRLSLTAGKMGFSMMAIIAIPLIFLMPEVLGLWLVEIPAYSVEFARLLIVACMIEQQTRGLVYATQAIGNIKWFSIVVSLCRFMALPISCVCIYCGYSAVSAIIIFVICETIGSASRVIMISKISSLNIKDFMQSNIVGLLPALCLSITLGLVCTMYLTGFVRMALTVVSTILGYISFFYLFGLTKDEKGIVLSIVRRFLQRNKNGNE